MILAGAGLSSRLFAASSDFWNKKLPAEWTPEEIDRLLTDSPWARPVKAEYSGDADSRSGDPSDPGGRGGSGGSGPWGEGGPEPRSRGISIPGLPRISLPHPSRRGKGPSPYQGTVMWESAKPIQEALKTPLEDVLENHYAITVNGIPLLSRGDEEDEKRRIEALKRFATLQVKGKEPGEADIARREVSNGSILVFGFRKDAPAISPNDKEVLFEARFSGLVVKAKFTPKEMLYRGALAL
jgi:hypothetical protein